MTNREPAMSTLTIHALDPEVEKRVRGKAKKERKSLNQTLKELLAEGVGCSPGSRADRGSEFAEFAGLWTDKDQREFEAATADLSRVEEAD